MIRRPPRSTLFPYTRSSDLPAIFATITVITPDGTFAGPEIGNAWGPDRKSTRLNSSHLVISYAVFCLKKKKDTIFSTRYSHHNDSHSSRRLDSVCTVLSVTS